MRKILIVDDDPELRSNLADILQEAGYMTVEVPNGHEAVTSIAEEEFDLVLLDMVMPGMKGVDTLMELKRRKPQTKVIMITAFATVQSAVVAIQKGASEYVTKPFKIDELLGTVGQVLEESRFEESIAKIGFESALSSLSNPIRRNIIRMLASGKTMRLMEITRELNIDDHTKIVFHLKTLKEADVIDQNLQKAYFLTQEGGKLLECLKMLEGFVAKD